MGRHHKRKRSTKVIETAFSQRIRKEDEERIKQSILKVFCTRSTSAKGLAETRTERKHSPKAPKGRNQKDLSSSSSDSMLESYRRKGKPKSSTKRQKIPQVTSTKKQAEKETEVARHLKVAHGFAYLHTSAEDGHKERRMTSICPGRLTRKVELLQTGKRSAPAKRGYTEPRFTTGSVDEEIKKLLGSTKTGVPTATNTNAGVQTPADMDTVESDGDDDCDSSYARTSANNNFSKKLDIKETIRRIVAASGLNTTTKELFPERDLLQEVTAWLRKLLVQNTPKNVTPTSCPLKVKGRGPGSIQRCLTESFLSCQDSIKVTDTERKIINTDLPTTGSCEQAKNRNYENSDLCMDTSQKNGLEFYQQKDRELRARQIGKVHYDSSASSVPKSYMVRKDPVQSHQESTKMSTCTERTVQSSSFPQKPETRFNFYTERNLNDHSTGNVRRQTEIDNNLQLLYNTAKLLEQEYCMLEQDRSKLKDDVAKSYRDNIKDTEDKPGDAFEAFFSENRHCEVLAQKPQEKAAKNHTITGNDSPFLDAVSLLQANEQLSSLESMEVDTQPLDAIDMLRENERLESARRANNQGPCDILRPCSEPRGIFTRDSRSNSQCSDGSRISQLGIQQRDLESVSSIHSYMAPQDVTVLCKRPRHTKPVDSMDFLDYVDHDQLARCASDRCYSSHQMPASQSSQECNLAVSPPFLSDVPQQMYKGKHSPWGQMPAPSVQHQEILRFIPLAHPSPVSCSKVYSHPEKMHMEKHSPHHQKPVSPTQRSWDDILGLKPLEHPHTFSPPTPDIFSHPRKMF